MADILQFIDERLPNSITALTPPVNPVDRIQPLTFTDWLKYNTSLFTTTSDFLNRYQSYLNNWYIANNASIEQQTTGVQNYYTNIISEIVLNYTSSDEQRYLQNLDLTNSRDLAIAVPFFAQKLKDICLYYSNLRDAVQSSAIQFNLKGSNTGNENLIYVSFIKALQTPEIQDQLTTLNLTISSISNNITIDVEELYDTYPDYYDINPVLPASAYNVTSGLRNDFFSANTVNIDPYLDLSINISILNAILAYPFYTQELGDSLTIDPLVNSSQLNLLKDSDFISTVNNGDVNNLNLQNQALELSKYMGVDYYYITTSTLNTFTSGILFTANSEFANTLNKRYPTIAAIPSQEFLKTAKEIGLFFKPDKIGLSNFTNFQFTASVDLTKLQPNSVYYFPDPSKYGNISGNSKTQFQSPLAFFEENYFNKIDYSNQYRFGDVATSPSYQTFRAYQSREQTLNYSNAGISRYIDSQDFFTGDMDTIWRNVDVYPLASVSQFPIASRLQDLLTINQNLFQYKSDVYGNEYGLYKTTTNKQFSTALNPVSTLDLIIDGFVFNTSAADVNFIDATLTSNGVNFNSWLVTNLTPSYSVLNLQTQYSGVLLDTSSSESRANNAIKFVRQPINSKYVISTLSGRNLNYIIDDGSSFSTTDDSNNVVILESYDFNTNDAFTSSITAINSYTCEYHDAVSFTRPYSANNAPLPDSPSDSPSFNISNPTLYYNELVDGAIININTGTGYIDSFSLNNPAAYITKQYDGGVFFDTTINAEPCSNICTHSYTENNTFVNSRLADRNTSLDFSLSGINTTQNSLYYTRNIQYGNLYFRNANSTTVGPISSTLSATFLNYPSAVQSQIYNNTINFDLYFDTLQIETKDYLVFDKIEYDYDTNAVIGSVKVYDVIPRGSGTDLEKFSTVWFDENTNVLMVCVTTLFNQLSDTNYKIVYPTIYTINLNNKQTATVYPTVPSSALTFNSLSAFSLYGQGIELNIISIEKPILNYSKDTDYFTLTYLGKDGANCFYIFTTRFQFINNQIININTTVHIPATNTYHINFANRLPNESRVGTQYLDTYTIIGSAAGYINTADNTFTWGSQ